MSKHQDDFELVRGTGNVFADLGRPEAQREHLRALLAAEILGAIRKRGWSYAKAEAESGVLATDLSCIGRVKLNRFTIDRLLSILDKLGQSVEVSVKVSPRRRPKAVQAELSA